MGSRYHVKVDGVGYLVRAGSYRRGCVGGDGGLKSWQVTDWRRGDGHEAGFGVDVATPGRLALGPAVAVSLATTEDGFAGFCPFGGRLYAASRSSGRVLVWDGGAWSVTWTAPAAPRSIGTAYGELMVGAADGKVYSFDPFVSAWGERFAVSASGEVTAVTQSLVEEAVTGGSTVETRALFGVSRASGSGRLVAISGDAAETLSIDVGESRVEALSIYRGRLYVATSWGSASAGGRLLVYGTRGGGSWWDLTEVAAFSESAPLSLAIADGLLWVGMADGRVLASDGTRVVEAYNLRAHGVVSPGPLRGLVPCGERLYVGFEHPIHGASLLSRLPAPESGAAWGPSGARDGWVMECGSGVAGAISALGVHGGTVFFARDDAGAATIYRRRTDASRTSGEVELSVFDGGELAMEKLPRRVVVLHEALTVGQSVKLSCSLDGRPWIVVGTSDVIGSTSKAFELTNATARLVGLKVELASGSAVAGPVVTAVVLEYSEGVDGRRVWHFEARCEGVPGLPLRLLDGIVEASSGAQLSATLRAALGKGLVDLEDINGVTYRVWVRGIEESLGEMPQENGAQTVARCVLEEW